MSIRLEAPRRLRNHASAQEVGRRRAASAATVRIERHAPTANSCRGPKDEAKDEELLDKGRNIERGVFGVLFTLT